MTARTFVFVYSLERCILPSIPTRLKSGSGEPIGSTGYSSAMPRPPPVGAWPCAARSVVADTTQTMSANCQFKNGDRRIASSRERSMSLPELLDAGVPAVVRKTRENRPAQLRRVDLAEVLVQDPAARRDQQRERQGAGHLRIERC